MSRRIYLDYAAATPVRDEVKKAMDEWQSFNFANPSAIYREAERAREALEDARTRIARVLGVKQNEVVFVSSSTEANNFAIFGAAKIHKSASRRTGHIITTQIEHPSIFEPVQSLDKNGWQISQVEVDKEGFIDLESVRDLLTKNTKLVTLAWANPDVGVVQPIRKIRKTLPGSVVLHIDGSQSGGALNINVPALGADLFTVSSSKIYGPPGIAALVVRTGTKIEPLIYGGGQEQERRSGTENVAAAVGFALAIEFAQKEQKTESEPLGKLRDKLIRQVLKIPDSKLTGPDPRGKKEIVRLPGHASFVFAGINGEELVVRLDERGFAVGTGSACATGKPARPGGGDEVSRAVRALGVGKEYEHGSLRVTLGRETTEESIDSFVPVLAETVEKMRQFSKL